MISKLKKNFMTGCHLISFNVSTKYASHFVYIAIFLDSMLISVLKLGRCWTSGESGGKQIEDVSAADIPDSCIVSLI